MSTSESTMRKKTLGHSFRRTFSLVLALTVSIGGFVVLWIESRMLDVRAIINIQEGGSWSSSVHNPYSLPVTTNGQNASYSHSHCYGALPKVPVPAVQMTDRAAKFSIIGIPKGGATVSTQVVLRHLGLMEEAIAYNSWIHNYRIEVFASQPNHHPARCDEYCGQPGWTCVKILRSIVDRAVSGYIHTLNYSISDKEYFPELHDISQEYGLKTGKNASFAVFLKAVRARRADWKRSLGDDHFLPQADMQCDNSSVLHIPLEALEEGFRLVNQTAGIYFNSTGFTSWHYVRKSEPPTTQTLIANIPHLPFSELFFSNRRLKFPYDAFFVDPVANSAFCELYCMDIQLYADMCQQPLLANNENIQEACHKERSRILDICGPVYDYF